MASLEFLSTALISFLAQSSASASTFNAFLSTPSHFGIIDLEASEHMKGMSSFFPPILYVQGRLRSKSLTSFILLLLVRVLFCNSYPTIVLCFSCA